MQLQAIKSFFADLPPEELRVLGMHHPLLGSGEKARALVAPLGLVATVFEHARVDLVLTGHFHQSKIGLFPEPQGTEESPARRLVVSQAPSICSTRLKGEPNGFHLLTLSRSETEIELWRWHVDRFMPEKTKFFGRRGDNWTEL